MKPATATIGRRTGLAQTLRDALAPIGMAEALPTEVVQGRALAAELIGSRIASATALTTLYARTGYGFYVVREEGQVTGVLALVFLNRAGLRAVLDDRFDPLRPCLEHVAAAGEEPAGVYGWGVAGATRSAAAIASLGALTSERTIPYPYFARAATDAGRRLVTSRLGLAPYPGSPSGLFWRDARTGARRAA